MNQLVVLCCEGTSAFHRESASTNRLSRWRGKSPLSKTKCLKLLMSGRSRLPSLYCQLYQVLNNYSFSTLRKQIFSTPSFFILYDVSKRWEGCLLAPSHATSRNPHSRIPAVSTVPPHPGGESEALLLFLLWGSRSSGCQMLLNNVHHGYKGQSAQWSCYPVLSLEPLPPAIPTLKILGETLLYNFGPHIAFQTKSRRTTE